MQLSYKVIDDSKIVKNNIKIVETKYKPYELDNNDKINLENNITDTDEKLNSIEEKYKSLIEKIIKNAQTKSKDILKEAHTKVPEIKMEAYDEAYKLGKEKGYEDGYIQGYEESYKRNIKIAEEESKDIINEANNKANDIIQNANRILQESKNEYAMYLENKKDEIKNLILTAIESILKEEVLKEDAVNNMIFDAISVAKDSQIIIIKCNDIYVDEIKNQIGNWKNQLAFNGEIFVIEDNTVSNGNACIEKNNGKILVGLDVGFTKIKSILYGDGE